MFKGGASAQLFPIPQSTFSRTESVFHLTPPHYERLSDKLLECHSEFEAISHRAREILATDPYNPSLRYHIKKLKDVPPGEGQFRLSLGRWRFRYDIYGREVVHTYCGLRREETYRH